MEKYIKELPSQLTEGYNIAGENGKEYEDLLFKNIIISGMGGSGLPGILLQLAAEELNINIPVYSHRNYGLPRDAHKESLIVVVSYSGNTEEVLPAYEEAKKLKAPLMVITSGGKLLDAAEKDGVPAAIIPTGIQPRMAVGYQFASLLGLLANAKVIENQTNELKDAQNSLDPQKEKERAEKLLGVIKNAYPIIYTSEKYEALGYITKIQLNETGKRHAFYNVLPEMNHNEIEGYEEENRNFASVFLLADDEHPRIEKRARLVEELFKEKNYPVHEVDIRGNTLYTKMFSTILLSQWLAYLLAQEKGIDPEKVEIIENLKDKL